MSIEQIASKLADYCRKGQYKEAQNELFAKDAVSIEQEAGGGFEKETRGIEAINKKADLWNSMVKESHGGSISEPLIAGNSFACLMKMDVTMQDGKRMQMAEIGVYRVKDGKIISEQFFM